MRIYNCEKEYWLISNVMENQKEKSGIKFKNNKFIYVEAYKNLYKAKEVEPHEYLFDNNKRTNIIYRMHNNISKAIKEEIEVGYTNRIVLSYLVKEFEETFKDVLKKFDVEFLAIENKEND